MKKILLAIDCVNINMNALKFSCYIAKLTDSELTGVFLENLLDDVRPVNKQLYSVRYAESIAVSDLPCYTEKIKKTEQNIQFFKEACERSGVKRHVHRDRGIPVKEIIEESRFADLIIVDAETSFSKKYEEAPTRFVKDVLAEAECPVIVAPESFESIEKIVFTYDGSSSAVFAIKQFTYLFPELKNTNVTLLEVNKTDPDYIEEKYKIKEWLHAHYSNVVFQVLQGNAKDELFGYLLKKKNHFIIMGAFGRGLASSLFKPSTATLVMKAISLPVFIAHH